MRRYLLDSNAVNDWMHHLKGVDVRAKQAAAAGGRLGTGTPAVGELIAGIEGSATRDRNMAVFRAALKELVIWPFDFKAAEEFDLLRADLKRRGRLMQDIDIQLAAIALTLGNTTVVSSDSDLLAVPGLAVEDWAA